MKKNRMVYQTTFTSLRVRVKILLHLRFLKSKGAARPLYRTAAAPFFCIHGNINRMNISTVFRRGRGGCSLFFLACCLMSPLPRGRFRAAAKKDGTAFLLCRPACSMAGGQSRFCSLTSRTAGRRGRCGGSPSTGFGTAGTVRRTASGRPASPPASAPASTSCSPAPAHAAGSAFWAETALFPAARARTPTGTPPAKSTTISSWALFLSRPFYAGIVSNLHQKRTAQRKSCAVLYHQWPRPAPPPRKPPPPPPRKPPPLRKLPPPPMRKLPPPGRGGRRTEPPSMEPPQGPGGGGGGPGRR